MSTTALSTVSSAPGWSSALTPQDTKQAWEIATTLAKSTLIPKSYQGQPGDIIIAANMGARLGLDPFSAMQGIAVVNGRPTLWGDAMLAICQARPDWRGQAVKWDGDGDKLRVTVTVRRQTAAVVDEYAGEFSVDDAKKAGLWTKQGPWSQYPKRMMELRARAYALRGAFADALMGFHSREEMEDAPVVDVTAQATVREEPRRKPRQVPVSHDAIGEVSKGLSDHIRSEIEKRGAAPAAVETSPAEQASGVAGVTGDANEAPAAGNAPATEQRQPDGGTTSSAPAWPTLDQVRAAVNSASFAAGGARKVIERIEKFTGYSVLKAEDIKPEHRAEAIKIANELAKG